MKTLLLVAFLTFFYFTSFGQYYYKDIIGVKETEQMIRAYQNNKVSHVVLNSYDADGTKSDDFFVEQQVNIPLQTLKTTTRSGVTDASVLTSFINADGRVIKTIDSTENTISTTNYTYNTAGLLTAVTSFSSDTSNSISETEEHVWEYNNNKITRMLRIKNKRDTTFVQFKADDKGNITEEQSSSSLHKTDPVYYYYDAKNRLTDIVRFNNKAKRLLPEYMFEYNAANQVIQKITVPANSSDYLIWRYQYNDKGLRTKEAVFDKQKKLTGTIQYQYQFSS